MFKVTIYLYNEDSWSQGDYKEEKIVFTENLDLAELFIQKYFDENEDSKKIYCSGYGSMFGTIEIDKPVILNNKEELENYFNNKEREKQEDFFKTILLQGATK